MAQRFRHILETKKITASAPCRIDLGGTLDISSVFYPLARLQPCTFNIALNMRTRASIGPFEPGWVKVSSSGFDSAAYRIEEMPFQHPVGLIFAVAAYFGIDGLHIEIESASPPRSALGGSSVAAVALIGAYNELFRKAGENPIPVARIPLLAHAIEESIAGVPCGKQDQLAAAYGGVNAWHWKDQWGAIHYEQQPLAAGDALKGLGDHLLVAYCGVPHSSADINGTWIRQFLAGGRRDHWEQIIHATNRFVEAFIAADFSGAARWMNRETAIRRELTPDVVEEVGSALIAAAVDHDCGARFAGAGGGGCLWAIGPSEAIAALKPQWMEVLTRRPDGKLMDVDVDPHGLRIE